jgi:hypothetical protein
MRNLRWAGLLTAPLVLGLAAATVPMEAGAMPPSFVHTLTSVTPISSTVPGNGDINPYGVAVVAASTGNLVAGDILVSNFNNKANVQGTGTTIVEVAPTGGEHLFASLAHLPSTMPCPGGVGLTTALDILPGGWVVVGSLPTKAGALPKENPAGCLIVLDSSGTPVETLTNADIVGPWDMTAESTATTATLFVSNALGGNTRTKKGVPVAGNCTVARLDLSLTSARPTLTSSTIVGTDFPWKANAAALVLAPTGLALSAGDTLYVDNSLTNTVSAIPHASTRSTPVTGAGGMITKGGDLSAPLGLTLTPGGDILVVNGNNGLVVQISPSGTQMAKKQLVKNGAGDLFGLAVTPNGRGIYFVNDGTNALDLAQPAAGG